MIIEDINKSIMNYVNEYNLYFYKHHFIPALEKMKQTVQEKYTKYIDVSKTYYSQIKETQFNLSKENIKTEEEIESIISSLKEIAFQKPNSSILFFQEKLHYSIYEKMN